MSTAPTLQRATQARLDDGETEITLLGIVRAVLRHRLMVFGGTLLAMVLAVLVSLVPERRYTSVSSFMPQSNRAASSISSLAAQLGIPVPGAEGRESPGFYAELVTTPGILREAVQTRYETTSGAGRRAGTLVQLYEVEGADSLSRLDEAMRELARDVTAVAVQKSGVVRVTARAKDPSLARAVNARILELVDRFNQQTRRSQAMAERQFTERRLAEVRADLRRAEDELQGFLSRNRDISNSPQLTFTRDRLLRRVMLQNEIATTLAKAYEQSRIEEVRDTPVLSVIEAPSLPVRPDSRQAARNAMVAGLVTLLLTMLVAVVRDVAAAARGGDRGDFQDLSALWAETKHDVFHPIRALRRRPRGA